MQFRRSGQRDDRRRRVLSDTRSGSAGVPKSNRGRPYATFEYELPERKSQNYGDAEFLDEQRRLADLVPTHLSVFALLLLMGLTVIAGLEILYTLMPDAAKFTADGTLPVLDLQGQGSLAVWLSSMTLAAAGFMAVLVFSVRRYKIDDYHGHYRIWLWAAMCWFLLSVDETAGLHLGFKSVMCHVTGTPLWGDGSLWWIAAYVLLLGAVGTRLLVDMRHCFTSVMAMLATAALYVVSVVAHLGVIPTISGPMVVMVEEGAEMAGNLMLLLSMGLHARFVILDAKGLLPERENAEEYDEEYEEEDHRPARGRGVTVHPPHGVSRPNNSLAAEIAAERAILMGTETAESAVRRKLTKAERKALRKRLRQNAMERQRGHGEE